MCVGDLLKNIHTNGAEIGIEVNPSARETAIEIGNKGKHEGTVKKCEL